MTGGATVGHIWGPGYAVGVIFSLSRKIGEK